MSNVCLAPSLGLWVKIAKHALLVRSSRQKVKRPATFANQAHLRQQLVILCVSYAPMVLMQKSQEAAIAPNALQEITIRSSIKHVVTCANPEGTRVNVALLLATRVRLDQRLRLGGPLSARSAP